MLDSSKYVIFWPVGLVMACNDTHKIHLVQHDILWRKGPLYTVCKIQNSREGPPFLPNRAVCYGENDERVKQMNLSK